MVFRVFRAQGWDESYLERLGPGRVLQRYVDGETEPCDAAFRITLPLYCFNLISIWITGHTAGPLISYLAFAIHLSQSLPFSLSLTHSAPCISINFVNSPVHSCVCDVCTYHMSQRKTQCSFLMKNKSWAKKKKKKVLSFTGDGCF